MGGHGREVGIRPGHVDLHLGAVVVQAPGADQRPATVAAGATRGCAANANSSSLQDVGVSLTLDTINCGVATFQNWG